MFVAYTRVKRMGILVLLRGWWTVNIMSYASNLQSFLIYEDGSSKDPSSGLAACRVDSGNSTAQVLFQNQKGCKYTFESWQIMTWKLFMHGVIGIGELGWFHICSSKQTYCTSQLLESCFHAVRVQKLNFDPDAEENLPLD